MKVILRKNFDQLGKIGDLVEVKDGYARNFLLPRHIAYIATKGNIRALEEEKQQLAKKEVKELEAAKEIAVELENVSITIPVKVGEEIIAESTKVSKDKKKWIIEVNVYRGNEVVFNGEFICFIPTVHVLEI